MLVVKVLPIMSTTPISLEIMQVAETVELSTG